MCEVLLLNPPFLDPTLPPHFAAYLCGAARAAGLDCELTFLDLNVELIAELSTESSFAQYAREISSYIETLERNDRLSRLDQSRLKYFRRFTGLNPGDVAQAISTFSTEERFYDFGLYQGAVTTLRRYVDAICALGLPGAFTFWDSNHHRYSELSSIDEICDPVLESAFWGPFERPLKKLLQPVIRSRPKVIGLSCNYESQLIFTVLLAKFLHLHVPSATLCIGGTEVTSIYKSIKNQKRLWELFPPTAHLVVGEGESAFTCLLRAALGDGQLDHPNIVTCAGDKQKITTAKIEDINAIGSPDYSIFDFSKYLSPEPVVLYSPTRGCYWNKCTFCDYGLNFGMPTSPSRQRNLAEALSELHAISKFSRMVYFAVDAISPSYLSRLGNGISHQQLGISWSAEIRLEAAISVRALATKLAEAGCIALSFGFESGSQRVLDAIKKGTKIGDVPELISSLTENGIHVQLMGFFGFPGETSGDAEETISFLRSQVNNFTILGMGNFVLTPGAIIAREPERFGIASVIDDDADIVRRLRWRDASEIARNGNENATFARAASTEFGVAKLPRPFVGGIDTAHTLLYFRKFRGGCSFERELERPLIPITPTASFETTHANFLDFYDLERDDLGARDGRRFGEFMKYLSEVDNDSKRELVEIMVKESGNLYTKVNSPSATWIDQLLQ